MIGRRCEDAPCCGHVECGFGPGVPGYGSMVGGVPYYGEHRDVFTLSDLEDVADGDAEAELRAMAERSDV